MAVKCPHRTVIACHHILTLYGHWAVNDPRGSGSQEFHDLKFEELGPIHLGRKPEYAQPSREDLRIFHQEHRDLLNFTPLWIDDRMRGEIAGAIEQGIRDHGYTCYACAILCNHLHLVIRTHKHTAREQWSNLAQAIRVRVRECYDIAPNHPVISARPYSVLLFTPHEVRGRIRYVNDNPEKERLTRQHWTFVQTYDNWPHHRAK